MNNPSAGVPADPKTLPDENDKLIPVSSRPPPKFPQPPPPPPKTTITLEFTEADYAQFTHRSVFRAGISTDPDRIVRILVDTFLDAPDEVIAWLRAKHSGMSKAPPTTANVWAAHAAAVAARVRNEHGRAIRVAEALDEFVASGKAGR